MRLNFRSFAPAVYAILGIQQLHEEQGRKMLTAEQRQQLTAAGFNVQFIETFENSMNEPDDEPQAHDGQPSARVAALSAALAQVTDQLMTANAEVARLQASSQASASEVAAAQARIAELEGRVNTLANLAEPDQARSAAAGQPAGATAFNLDDDAQLGGFPGAMFALDRPYNQRARAAIAARRGKVLMVDEASSIDYSRLTDDLGAFYRVSWRDRIQSMLAALPTVEKIWPLESGFQDLATLTNIWLGDFSQADNTIGSSFDNVTKGSFEFGTETLRMYSVMFAYTFQDLAAVEKTWIGHVNREGSDPLKLSFVEYLLTKTAEKLHNERELRRINGVRKNPDPNKPGRAMEASDGFYEFIRKKVEGHIDNTPDGGTTGRVVYQIKPFKLPHITPANIGEVLEQGTAMIPAQIRDAGNVVCYIPSPLVPWYHKYNETHYGVNQDYNPNIMHIKEYPSVKLVPVPNADNHHRIVWTIKGNVKCYEHKPGEMLNFKMQPMDWRLKVWANWKESVWAEAVGYKYTDPAEMDGSRQLIWCNDYDRPDDFFIEGSPDANPSVLRHRSVVTVRNSNAFAITDIENARVGDVVNIKCGVAGEHGVSIKKTGKFELISADWNPAKGDIISLMKNSAGKFIEIGRRTAASEALAFDDNEATPSLADATVFVTGANTEATAITGFTDAIPGEVYTIHGNGSTFASTIANSGKFVLSKPITLRTGAQIRLVMADSGLFYEVDRVDAPSA
ncbi:MAG: hypothetical protein K2H87_05275 [Duncaniella sp.]|nr:hypothetical protein [Duncaniella sp.]